MRGTCSDRSLIGFDFLFFCFCACRAVHFFCGVWRKKSGGTLPGCFHENKSTGATRCLLSAVPKQTLPFPFDSTSFGFVKSFRQNVFSSSAFDAPECVAFHRVRPFLVYNTASAAPHRGRTADPSESAAAAAATSTYHHTTTATRGRPRWILRRRSCGSAGWRCRRRRFPLR